MAKSNIMAATVELVREREKKRGGVQGPGGWGRMFQREKHLPLTTGVICSFLKGGRVQGSSHGIQEAPRSTEETLSDRSGCWEPPSPTGLLSIPVVSK